MIYIKIKGLFEKFNYYIEFSNEGPTIITGPNGYGKSTILRIIGSLSKKPMELVRELNKISFSEIEIKINLDSVLNIKKTNQNIELNLNGNNLIINCKEYNRLISAIEDNKKAVIRRKFYGGIEYKNTLYDEVEYMEMLKKALAFKNNTGTVRFDKFKEFVSKINKEVGNIYYIKEQRLIETRITSYDETEVINKIEKIAKTLKGRINEAVTEYSVFSSELDGSYPYRLFENDEIISESDFQKKMKQMRVKLQKMDYYKLTNFSNKKRIVYKEEFSKALKIYFDDFDKKYEKYKDIINDLDLYMEIVNSKLQYKQIKVDNEIGIKVFNEKKKELDLNELSSGEKQIIVLYYELIFESDDVNLILIDEPEISWHIIWQDSFMDDLIKITKSKGIKSIIATHSPEIIGNYWDLQRDLNELRYE